MDTNTPRYYIATRTNMLRPAEDRVRFAARCIPDIGWVWDCAERAEPYTAADLGEMLPLIKAARENRYVSNGEALPADLYIIPEEVGLRIAARNDDNSLYDWEGYTGDDDDEAQGAWMQQQDVALCEAEALDWDAILADLPATPADADIG